MKKQEIATVYRALDSLKLTKMDADGKFNVIKILRALRAGAKDFEDFQAEAREKLKPEDFDERLKRVQEWQKQEQSGEEVTLPMAERVGLNKYFADYNQSVTDCVREEGEKEVEVNYDKLSEDAFKSLLGSNDLTAGAGELLAEHLIG